VINFIIGTIYGHPEVEGGKKKNVGILQLINKCDNSPVTENDRVRICVI
jgi:hypothetical protein